MKYIQNILNFIYPPICGFCNNINENFICNVCNQKINNIKISSIEKYPLENFYFNEHFYMFKYENEIRDYIIKYKFNEKSYLYKTFSSLFIQDNSFRKFISNYNCILSVPIHKKRMHTRGYNQSELIAKDLAKVLKLEFHNDILIKNSNIIAQSSLNREERKSNIANAFSVLNINKVLNKNVIIFDDIFTTGSTLNECSKILLQNGVQNIGVVTLAKD